MSYSDALDGHVRIIDYLQSSRGRGDFNELPSVQAAGIHLVNSLRVAATYYVSGEISDLLKQVGQSLPDTASFISGNPDERHGFVWLEQPMPVQYPSKRGMQTALRCYSWHETFRREEDLRTDGLLLLLFEEEEGYLFPGVVSAMFIPFELPLSEIEFTKVSIPETSSPEDANALVRWHYCLLAFMRDSILKAAPQEPSRATRRRLPPQWKASPLIRVVQLRRAHYAVHESRASDSVKWAHRWLVGGHWRQQWYPSVERHQLKWIAPYVKGPDDKPVKAPRATIFAVTR